MMRPTKSRIGRNLRAFRAHVGLTQAEFAQEIGMSLRYYSDVERGRENLTLDSVDALAADLGIDPVALIAADADGWTRGVIEAAAGTFSAMVAPEPPGDLPDLDPEDEPQVAGSRRNRGATRRA